MSKGLKRAQIKSKINTVKIAKILFQKRAHLLNDVKENRKELKSKSRSPHWSIGLRSLYLVSSFPPNVVRLP